MYKVIVVQKEDAEVESREDRLLACWLIETCGVSDTGPVSNIVFESTDDDVLC